MYCKSYVWVLFIRNARHRTTILHAVVILHAIAYALEMQGSGPATRLVLKIQVRLGFSLTLNVPGSCRALESDHNALCICFRASCGAWKMQTGLDAEPTRFRVVPFWAQVWLLETFFASLMCTCIRHTLLHKQKAVSTFIPFNFLHKSLNIRDIFGISTKSDQ